MGFTNVWDDTQPPDTQAANLLGDDIRTLKVDVEQRLAQGFCGLFANQPALEAVFGSANNGIPYFATDRKKLYQFNGTAYVEVGCWQTFADVTTTAVVNPGAETVLNTITIPAGFLSAGYSLEIFASAFPTAGGTKNDTFKIYCGAVLLDSISVVNSDSYNLGIFGRGLVISNTVLSLMLLRAGFEFSTTGTVLPITAIDVTSSMVIKTTVLANANRTYNPAGLFVKAHK